MLLLLCVTNWIFGLGLCVGHSAPGSSTNVLRTMVSRSLALSLSVALVRCTQPAAGQDKVRAIGNEGDGRRTRAVCERHAVDNLCESFPRARNDERRRSRREHRSYLCIWICISRAALHPRTRRSHLVRFKPVKSRVQWGRIFPFT